MKILEFCLSENLGGLELYVHKCSIWLQRSEHDLVAATRSGSRLAVLAQEQHLEQFHLPKAGKIFPLRTARLLSAKIDALQIDIVHLHHKDDLPLLAWTKKICPRSFKLVHTRHMQIPSSKKDLYHRFIYNSIDLLLTVTDALRKEAEAHLPLADSKIKRLYLGVSEAVRKSSASCDSLIPRGEEAWLNIGVFSRIEALKGQHLIVEAARKLQEQALPVRFYLFGDVMNEDYFSQLEARIIEEPIATDRVRFMGFHAHPMKIMPCFDVILLPSKAETFGLVLVEAMRSGVAVMGTNAGGVPEIVDDNSTGLLFDWDDVDMLVEKLTFLYKNPEKRQQLAEQGKAKADSVFDEKKHFMALEKLMEGV